MDPDLQQISWDLQGIGYGESVIAVMLGAGAGPGQEIFNSLSSIAGSVGSLAVAVAEVLPDALSSVVISLASVSEIAGVLDAHVHGDLSQIAASMTDLGGPFGKRSAVALEQIRSYQGGQTEALQGLVALIRAVTGFGLSDALGKAPLVDQDEQATVGGSVVQSVFDAVVKVFQNAPGSDGPLDQQITPTLAQAQVKGSALGDSWKGQFYNPIVEMLNTVMGWKHVAPGDAPANVARAYGFASALGFLAHGISALSSVQFLGCGALKLSGLAGFVGKMAGFNQIAGAVMGELYRAWIAVPWRQYLNRQFTPYIPGAGDVLRLRGKRLLPGCVKPEASGVRTVAAGPSGNLPGFDQFADLLGQLGYSREWAQTYEDDLYTEPRYRELLVMGENDEIPAAWWWRKLRALAYDEDDAAKMVGGLQRMQSRAWIARWVGALLNQRRLGVLDDDTLRDGLKVGGISGVQADWIGRASAAESWGDYIKEEIDLLEQQYERAMLTDEEFRDGLDGLGLDAWTVKYRTMRARLRRYHKVWLMTPTEQARQAVAAMKKLFRAGQITGTDLWAKLVEAGIDPDAADFQVMAEDLSRQRTLAVAFRAVPVTMWRDMVLNGLLTILEYRAKLLASLFPAEYVQVEIALVTAKVEARRQQRVSRNELPHYRRAYVVGLISAAELDAVMRLAGLTDVEIAAAHLTADYERGQELARQRERQDQVVQDAAEAVGAYAAG